jgi:uncharacterized protein YbjT (DUF2867 family)
MRIVVVGGRGRVGSELVRILGTRGHDVLAASRSSGVDAVTGKGLATALADADVLVDVTESPSRRASAVLDFFTTVTWNLLAAAAVAGVRHYVALSLVGVNDIKDNGYFHAKAAQEKLIRDSSVPYTIVRSTQFFNLLDRILEAAADGDVVRLYPTTIQPVAADDVAEALAEIAIAPPLNGVIELAGAEAISLDELARLILSAREDPRPVVTDRRADFLGSDLKHRSLIPGPNTRIGTRSVRDWLRGFITAD